MPYVMLASLSLLWGSSFFFIKIATNSFDPIGFAFGRVGVAAFALALAAFAARLAWPRGGRMWLRLLGMSALGQVGPFLLLGLAARMTTSADLALTMAGIPIFTALLSRLFGLGEPTNFAALAGLALGLAGVALSLGLPGDGAPEMMWGRALGLLASLGYAGGALMSKEASRAVGSQMSATASLCLSAALLALLWIAAPAGPAVHPNWREIGALVALGLANTALAYLLYFRLVAVAGATFGALNNYIVPFVGLALGAALLGDPIRPASIAGLGLVLASVALTGWGARGAGESPARLAAGS